MWDIVIGVQIFSREHDHRFTVTVSVTIDDEMGSWNRIADMGRV